MKQCILGKLNHIYRFNFSLAQIFFGLSRSAKREYCQVIFFFNKNKINLRHWRVIFHITVLTSAQALKSITNWDAFVPKNCLILVFPVSTINLEITFELVLSRIIRTIFLSTRFCFSLLDFQRQGSHLIWWKFSLLYDAFKQKQLTCSLSWLFVRNHLWNVSCS